MEGNWWEPCGPMINLVRNMNILVYSVANIVLEGTEERIFVGNKFCSKPLGVFLIRGENVELLAEIVCHFSVQN